MEYIKKTIKQLKTKKTIMSYELKGEIIKIYEKQVFKETFEKKEFVVRTSEDYPQEIKFEVTQKMVSLLDDYKEGDDIVINFNIKGKESKGNYWNNLSVWRLRKTQDVSETPSASPATTSKKKLPKKVAIVESAFENPTKDEDMPF